MMAPMIFRSLGASEIGEFIGRLVSACLLCIERILGSRNSPTIKLLAPSRVA